MTNPVIRVGFEGMEIAMKVGSASIGMMQRTMKFIYGMLNFEKSMGKTSMKQLLMRGGDLQSESCSPEYLPSIILVRSVLAGPFGKNLDISAERPDCGCGKRERKTDSFPAGGCGYTD